MSPSNDGPSPTALSTNKATFLRFHNAISSGDVSVLAKTIDEVVARDVVLSTPLPVAATGSEGLKEAMTTLLRAFPDLQVTVADMIEQDDKVAGRNVLTGTHRGDYLGVAPTGRVVTYNEIFIFRFAHGRIAETWGVVDVVSQLRQLGVLSQ